MYRARYSKDFVDLRDNPYLKTIEMLQEKLDQLGWSQSDLARESGVSRVTINRVFNLKQVPDAATINKLGTVLGFSPGQIAGKFLITGELMWNMIGAKKDLRDSLLWFFENYLVNDGFLPKQPLTIRSEMVDEIVQERAQSRIASPSAPYEDAVSTVGMDLIEALAKQSPKFRDGLRKTLGLEAASKRAKTADDKE